MSTYKEAFKQMKAILDKPDLSKPLISPEVLKSICKNMGLHCRRDETDSDFMARIIENEE